MVRTYRPKIGGMPHARLDRVVYLRVFRHHISGQPPALIAQYLNIPGPTVRRALGRLRLAMINSTAMTDYMRKMGEYVHSQRMSLYEDIFVGIWSSYFNNNRIGLEQIDNCLRACPLGQTPSQFKKSHLSYGSILFDDISFVVPTATDHQAYLAYLDRMQKCRFCKAKSKTHSYRAVVTQVPQVYLDYMHYFSARKISKPSRNELLQLHLDATTFSMLSDIYAKHYTDEYGQSGSFAKAEKALADFFMGTTAGMFGLIEQLDVDELKYQ